MVNQPWPINVELLDRFVRENESFVTLDSGNLICSILVIF